MRRLCRSFYFCFLTVSSYGQVNHDSIAKYSYFIYGTYFENEKSDIQSVQGTCFFVKDQGKAFLVTAKHLLTSWSGSKSIKPVHYPDTLFLRIPKETGFTFYPIDIREIRSKIEGSFYYNEPDIYKMVFIDANKFKLNTIEVRSRPILTNPKNAEAYIYGFPSLKEDRFTTFALNPPSLINASLLSSPDENINYRDNTMARDVFDSINYVIKPISQVESGYSGAPVFLKYENELYFEGVVSQGVNLDNVVFIVKSKYVFP